MVNLVTDLEKKSNDIRKDVLTLVYNAKAGHIGGSMSSCDVVTTLYYSVLNIDPKNPKDENRDRFIMSKGHAAELLYCVLANKGYFPKENLTGFCKYGSTLIGHPNNKNAGVEFNTGALGHGLPVGVGMALGLKRDKKDSRVFTLMGDGELAEGSVWEGAMAAAHYKLDNLVGIIDRNRLQISGSTEDVMALDDLEEKWTSFGWNVVVVNGHNFEELLKVFSKDFAKKDKPTMVIANTVKGKGISFMENLASWHHGVPNEEQYNIAMNELSK